MMAHPNKDDTGHAKTVQVSQENNENIYSVLPPHHIRLLDLSPGSKLDLVEVNLHVVPITATGNYKAFSYVCGSTTDDLHLILCDGNEFMVTANLHAALIRYRDPLKTLTLWVDAICIHQGSISERSQQVRMMSQIYEGAEEVLVWLGEGDPQINIKKAFEVVLNRKDFQLQCESLDQPDGPAAAILCLPNPDLYDIIEEVQQRFSPPTLPKDHNQVLPEILDRLLKKSWTDYPNSHLLMYIGGRHISGADFSNVDMAIVPIIPDWDINHVRRVANEKFDTFTDFLKEATKPAEMRLSDEESASVYQAMNFLLNKPYFQRAWVVQEIILSQKATLACGEHEVDFQSFWNIFGLDRLRTTPVANFLLDDFNLLEAKANAQKISAWLPYMTVPSQATLSKNVYTCNQMVYLRNKARESELGLFDIGGLLHNFGKQKSTDPRDLIFSLVGILQKFSNRPRVLEWAESGVDYSLDVRDVYLQTAKHIAENKHDREKGDTRIHGSYHILDFFSHMSEPCPEFELPTWVPNWSADRNEIVFNTRRVFETGSLIPYDALVQGESLMISGCVVDEVTFCSDILLCNEQMFQEVDLCYMLVEREFKKKAPSVYGEFKAQFEGFWRTIIADNPIGSKPFTDFTYHFQEQEEVYEWLTQCRLGYHKIRKAWQRELKHRAILGPALARLQGDHSDIASLVDDEKVNFLFRRLEKTRLLELLELDEPRWGSREARLEMTGHILIKTTQGYFGLAHPSVQHGDIVTLLAGCHRPWYLRRQGSHYKIVGYAWISGLMYRNDPFFKSDKFREGCTQLELR